MKEEGLRPPVCVMCVLCVCERRMDKHTVVVSEDCEKCCRWMEWMTGFEGVLGIVRSLEKSLSMVNNEENQGRQLEMNLYQPPFFFQWIAIQLRDVPDARSWNTPPWCWIWFCLALDISRRRQKMETDGVLTRSLVICYGYCCNAFPYSPTRTLPLFLPQVLLASAIVTPGHSSPSATVSDHRSTVLG